MWITRNNACCLHAVNCFLVLFVFVTTHVLNMFAKHWEKLAKIIQTTFEMCEKLKISWKIIMAEILIAITSILFMNKSHSTFNHFTLFSHLQIIWSVSFHQQLHRMKMVESWHTNINEWINMDIKSNKKINLKSLQKERKRERKKFRKNYHFPLVLLLNKSFKTIDLNYKSITKFTVCGFYCFSFALKTWWFQFRFIFQQNIYYFQIFLFIWF